METISSRPGGAVEGGSQNFQSKVFYSSMQNWKYLEEEQNIGWRWRVDNIWSGFSKAIQNRIFQSIS